MSLPSQHLRQLQSKSTFSLCILVSISSILPFARSHKHPPLGVRDARETLIDDTAMRAWLDVMPILNDTLLTAQYLGRTTYLAMGERVYPQLQINHLLLCMKRTHFDDRPMRIRRHLLVIAPPAVWKSSAAMQFMERLAGATEDTSDRTRPRIVDVCDTTWEAGRGSVAGEGKHRRVTTPVYAIADYLFASEFMSFLGTSRAQQKERVFKLNKMMEEATMSFGLVKAHGAKGPTGEGEDRCAFNPETGVLIFKAKGIVVGCTIPPEKEEMELIERSGLKSRMVVCEWHPTDAEHREMWMKGAGRTPEDAAAQLRSFNEKAWRLVFERVNSPPDALIKVVKDLYDDYYNRIERLLNISTLETRSNRDTTEIAMLIAAHAIARNVSEWDTTNGWIIPELTYREIDAIQAREFARDHLEALYAEWMRNARAEPKGDDSWRVLDTYYRYRIRKEQYEYEQEREEDDLDYEPGRDAMKFRDADFVSAIMDELSISRPTAYRKLGIIKRRGFAEPNGQAGYSTIPEKYVRELRSDMWDPPADVMPEHMSES